MPHPADDLDPDTHEAESGQRQRRHRTDDPPATGKGWEISRAIEPWYQLIKKVGVIALIWPAIKLALALEQLPKEVTALKQRVDALEALPAQLQQLKTTTCFSIPSRERRYYAGCPPEIEDVIGPPAPPAPTTP